MTREEWRAEIQRQRWAIARRKANDKLKLEVLAAYGGACACCGEREPLFLQVDHVDHAISGKQHRRQLGNGHIAGMTLYQHIRRDGFPPAYRLLCANCNSGRWRNGGICPHEAATT